MIVTNSEQALTSETYILPRGECLNCPRVGDREPAVDRRSLEKERKHFSQASSGKGRILVVDDDRAVRELLTNLLKEHFDCVMAGSAEDALDLLHREKFALVISDIMMDGMSGLEMVPHVIDIAPDTVIVISSSIETVESAFEALRAGVYDYITKPFDLKQLENIVARSLNLYELRLTKRFNDQRLEELVAIRTAELDEANQTLQALVHASPLAILLSDTAGRIKTWNPAAERISGWAAAEVLNHRFPSSRMRGQDSLFEAVAQGKSLNGVETRLQRKDGTSFDASIWTALITDKEGNLRGRMAEVADITERKQATDRINYLAYHDPLTGLPNRLQFEERLSGALSAAGDREGMVGVIFIALDRFKKFNDTLGHATGDHLLCAIAERLKAGLSENHLLALFGSDEFALLMPGVESEADATATADRIQELLKSPLNIDERELYVTASIGIDLCRNASEDAAVLMKNAGVAMFRAKQHGGDNYQFYTVDMNEEALNRLSLESDLRRAIEREEFTVYYQPRVALNTGRIVGMEALIRWRHPQRGLIRPAEFIPLAEDTGIIVPIGEWVLLTACRQNKLWQKAGFPPLCVSVNISQRQFQQPNLLEKVQEILKETALDPHLLELELTETSLMQNTEQGIVILRKLKETGLKISIDDFGSGYSSLSYLKCLPIDILKIDQSFVRDTTLDPTNAAIIMAIITLGHNLNLEIVAEGVETDEQMRFLRLLKCDQMQGCLFSKALPVEEFENLMNEERQLYPARG